jgi:ribosome-associated translation inhibitor RaiA
MGSATGTVDIEVHASRDVPREQVEAARERIAAVGRYAKRPPSSLRLTIRREPGHPARARYIADASMVFEGRVLAAHTAGRTPEDAADAAAERLRRQLRRVVDADVAMRNEPRVLEAALRDLVHDREHRPRARLKPPGEREIVATRVVSDEPETTLGAVADLLDHDLEFNLFRHAKTGEPAVVYRRDDGNIGLLHLPGSPLAEEGDHEWIIPEPSRYADPIPLAKARSEMDVLNHRFLFFVDAEDGRGKVIYLRHDGDYGLVELGAPPE